MKRFPLFALVATVLAMPCSAAQLAIHVSDRVGVPVPDTVVELDGAPTVVASPEAATLVDQNERKFVPHVSVVRPGGAVRFPNSDDTRHSVYSFTEGSQFELQLYRENAAPPVTMGNSGVVKLGCNIHDNMKAYLFVTANRSAVVTDIAGIARLSDPALQSGATLRLWHPQMTKPLTVSVKSGLGGAGEVQDVVLPISWVDPQAGKSAANLEQLLKRYARDSN